VGDDLEEAQELTASFGRFPAALLQNIYCLLELNMLCDCVTRGCGGLLRSMSTPSSRVVLRSPPACDFRSAPATPDGYVHASLGRSCND